MENDSTITQSSTMKIKKLNSFLLAACLTFLLLAFKGDDPKILTRGIKLLEKEMVKVTATNADDYTFLISPWVTNLEYKHYLAHTFRIYGLDYRSIIVPSLPCPKVPNGCPLPQDYFTRFWMHPAFNDYPVVGLSWKQAMDYAHWRTHRTNEWLYIKAGLTDIYVDQFGEDVFNIEALVSGQYESGKRKDFRAYRDLSDSSTEPIYGWYVPGFRLPTSTELQKTGQETTWQEQSSKLKSPLLKKQAHVMSTAALAKRYGEPKPRRPYKNDSLRLSALNEWMIYSPPFTCPQIWPTFNFGTHVLRGTDSYYREVGMEADYLFRANNDALTDLFLNQRLVDYLKQVDDFAASEANRAAVAQFFQQPAYELLLNPQNAAPDANLATLLRLGGQAPGFKGVLDDDGPFMLEKDSLGRVSIQIIGIDEQLRPITVIPHYQNSYGQYIRWQGYEKYFPEKIPRQVIDNDGNSTVLPADSSHYLARIRVVCTPYPILSYPIPVAQLQ